MVISLPLSISHLIFLLTESIELPALLSDTVEFAAGIGRFDSSILRVSIDRFPRPRGVLNGAALKLKLFMVSSKDISLISNFDSSKVSSTFAIRRFWGVLPRKLDFIEQARTQTSSYMLRILILSTF